MWSGMGVSSAGSVSSSFGIGFVLLRFPLGCRSSLMLLSLQPHHTTSYTSYTSHEPHTPRTSLHHSHPTRRTPHTLTTSHHSPHLTLTLSTLRTLHPHHTHTTPHLLTSHTPHTALHSFLLTCKSEMICNLLYTSGAPLWSDINQLTTTNHSSVQSSVQSFLLCPIIPHLSNHSSVE